MHLNTQNKNPYLNQKPGFGGQRVEDIENLNSLSASTKENNGKVFASPFAKIPAEDSLSQNDTLSPPRGVIYTEQPRRKKINGKIKGTLSVGYNYGFIPYTIDGGSPTSAFRSEGAAALDLLSLPLDVTYFYSNQKNLIGLNNYFRVSFNAERYKDKLTGKTRDNLNKSKSNLNSLNVQKQELLQKMAFSDYLLSIPPDKWPVSTPSVTLQQHEIHVLSGEHIEQSVKDSIEKAKLLLPVPPDQQKISYRQRIDSVSRIYETYKNNYQNLSDSIKRVQGRIEELEAFLSGNPTPGGAGHLNKLENFFSGVKKLDVGLCYPSYSTFLANNIPLRGVNFEYEKNKLFFAFTYGTTINTLFSANRGNIDNALLGLRNPLQYFDANNLTPGRKILSAKVGFGEKNGNHAFIGFLVGKGYDSYFELDRKGGQSIEKNLVLEADVRQAIGKNTALEIVGGKSALLQAGQNMDLIQSASRELFSNYRSYALQTKLSTKLSVTRTDVSFAVRWVDPFFKSFGIGFIRSDNLRYEVRVDQPIGKKIRYSVVGRHEEDNLLRLLDYKNTFYSLNNNVTFRVKRGLTLRLGYTPLTRTLNGSEYRMISKSSIVTGIVSYTPVRRNLQLQFNAAYNRYLVNTDSVPIDFQNFSYYHQVAFKSGFRTGVNLSWFKNNVSDTIGNDVFLAVVDAGYVFKNSSSISAAGKVAYKVHDGYYPGFILKSGVKISKLLIWENQVEKFIVGELFSGDELSELKKFPYCFSTKLIANF